MGNEGVYMLDLKGFVCFNFYSCFIRGFRVTERKGILYGNMNRECARELFRSFPSVKWKLKVLWDTEHGTVVVYSVKSYLTW